MNSLKTFFTILLEWISAWLKNGLVRLWGAFSGVNSWIAPPERRSSQADLEEWKTKEPLRTYQLGDGAETMVTIQTSTHAFHVSKKHLKNVNQKLAKGQKSEFNGLFWRWTSDGFQSAVSTSEPCPSQAWERRQRASSTWTTCPPPSSTVFLNSPSRIGLLCLGTSWAHTYRFAKRNEHFIQFMILTNHSF